MDSNTQSISIIGTVGVPARYGGFETLAHYLVDNLSEQNDLTVYCSKPHYKEEERVSHWKKAKLVYLPLKANGIQSIPYDIISIFHALIYTQQLIILGVSGCICLPFVRLISRKKITINIDGLEWKRDKWSKPIKKFLKFSESLAVRYADNIVADNAVIQQYVLEEYGVKCALIEYGADHVKASKLVKADYEQKFPFLKKDYAFKVCRIEPENNVHVILKAFSELPNRTLAIVGNWTNSDYGNSLLQEFKDCDNIHLLDPIYDQEMLNLLRSNCSLYVHGHSAGGTNPSLVEAMYLGLPILAFNVAYNQKTTEGLALYFDNEIDLIDKLQVLEKRQLEGLGVEMKSIAERRYLWNIIAQKYSGLLSKSELSLELAPVEYMTE